MGDTNCDILKVPFSSDTKRLDEIHNLYSLHNINTKEYTRVTSSSKTLIDHMLTNTSDRVKSHGVIHMGISDHSMSYVIWKSTHESSSRTINFRKLTGIDLDSFSEDLSKQPWHEILESESIDKALDKWEHLLMMVVNKSMPLRSKRVRSKKSPWMNSDIIKLIRERDM